MSPCPICNHACGTLVKLIEHWRRHTIEDRINWYQNVYLPSTMTPAELEATDVDFS